ncbi:uncharacterized protein LOC130824822 [Amaranthus tricolor]|uniref:uncharacterized protein LOC130824822 n=1 Tax=Amaranthus tricolor TaxID=29722 RepID=UPI00258E37D1|nr:uncharacterized protein LOC130824822 [Amaranthus tricolor]
MTTGKKFPTSLVRLTNPTICVSCEAKIFAYESKLFCCGDGINKISMNEYPSQLIELFSSDSETGIHFRKYCRLYNNVFAFKAGKPKFLQLYFFDGQFEKEHCSGTFPELNPTIVSLLMEIMNRSPYQRLYNAPASDKLAAILLDDLPSNETRSPYIAVWYKSSISHCLRKASYDNRTSRLRNHNPITPHLANTAEEFLLDEASEIDNKDYHVASIMLKFVVDMYVKIENTHLDFVRNNQAQLRAELYQGINDSVNNGECCA